MSSELLDFQPPSKRFVKDLMRPFRQYFAPRYYGFEQFDHSRPALFICNHTVYGLTDGFFLGAELYERFNMFVRPLVDTMHYNVPIWKDMVQKLGFIPASREACRVLMDAGESIMVFPGGTREAFKHKEEEYLLTWKYRIGFAKMAIENGYDIIPVAGLGGDEMYKILMDAEDVMHSPFGKFLKMTGVADKFLKGGDNIPPISRGIGWTGIPRPERVYIYVGERISTEPFAGHEDDEAALFQLRSKVENAIYAQFEELKAYRENDTDEEWWRKLLKKL